MDNPKLTRSEGRHFERESGPRPGEKRTASVTTTPPTDSASIEEQAEKEPPTNDAWRPSIISARPLLGLVALFVTVCCLFCALAVLQISQGQPQKDWYFQPTVYLAMVTAISNTALAWALSLAGPVAFWYRALRGSTIQDLELEWEASQGVVQALMRCFRHKRRVRLLTVAGFAVAVVVIDGPLLQRASSVRYETSKTDVMLDFETAPELLSGFSARYTSYLGVVNHPIALEIAQELTAKGYIDDKAIQSKTACPEGSCRMKIHGPGVKSSNCSEYTWPITKSIMRGPNATWGTGQPWMAPMPILSTNLHQAPYPDSPNGPETAVLAVGRATYVDRNGSFVLTNCDLTSAILEYDIILEGHSLRFPEISALREAPVIAEANNTFLNFTKGAGPQYSTTNGLFTYLEGFIQTNASLGYMSNTTKIPTMTSSSENAMSRKYIHESNVSANVWARDPTPEIIGDINLFFLRAGILTSSWKNATQRMDPGLSTTQRVKALQTRQQNVFHSDLRWFAGAAAVQLLAVLLVLPVFWGWWLIGTDLTLSPFQTAKLLDAPIFRSVDSGVSRRGSVWDMQEVQVRLGLVEDRVVVHESDRADIDGNGNARTRRESRVGIAESDSVLMPRRSI